MNDAIVEVPINVKDCLVTNFSLLQLLTKNPLFFRNSKRRRGVALSGFNGTKIS